jgi:hypothetical protein
MRTRKHRSLFLSFLILGVGLPGLIGIYVVQVNAVAEQNGIAQRALLQVVNTSTPTPTSTSAPLPAQTLAGSPLNVTLPPAGASPVKLYAFIQAPTGPLARPYVILTAFSSVPRRGSVTIRGFINTQEFICTVSPCAVYLSLSSRLVFRAYADTGEASDEVIATVSVGQREGAYYVTIDSVNQFTSFVDSCSIIWGVSDKQNATWDNYVQFPYQLHTRKTLHMLATQLIINGIVDASGCPGGGLSVGLDWPTACGLERASGAMIEWQNQFDEYIWLASRDQGVPPKLLKTIIEVESQFWPANSRFYIEEYGLGQINQLGVDVLLRRDPTLYLRVCPGVLSDCTMPYTSLSAQHQAMIRGAVVGLTDATCADCPYGLDLDKAKESVSIIAMLLKANCQQVDSIVAADVRNATYEDLWRFTLASHHNGIGCFLNAVRDTRDANLSVTWANVQENLTCTGGPKYVNGVMNNLFTYDLYLYQPIDSSAVLPASTLVPTRTPIPTPTLFISSAQIKVQVFIDRNGNGAFDSGEGVNAMTVLVTPLAGEQITKRTENGIVVFDMSGYRPGIGVTVSLPGLYRSESFSLPQQGEVSVIFKFDQPALPTIIP